MINDDLKISTWVENQGWPSKFTWSQVCSNFRAVTWSYSLFKYRMSKRLRQGYDVTVKIDFFNLCHVFFNFAPFKSGAITIF